MILEVLSHPSDFKGTDLALINYLSSHLDTAESLTIRNLAEKTYTSITTINRFCNRIFGMGFREFKIQLIKEINESDRQNNINIDLPFSYNDSINSIGHSISIIKENALKDTASLLDYDSILHLITMILKADRIFLFGKGESWICAEIFRARLMKLNCYSINGEEYSFTAYNVANLSSKDLALFITYSGNHKSYNSYLPILKKKNVQCAVITANSNSYLCRKTDCQILIPHIESYDEKISNFASTEELGYVLDVIFAGIFKYNYTQNINDRLHKEKYTSAVMMDDNSY